MNFFDDISELRRIEASRKERARLEKLKWAEEHLKSLEINKPPENLAKIDDAKLLNNEIFEQRQPAAQFFPLENANAQHGIMFNQDRSIVHKKELQPITKPIFDFSIAQEKSEILSGQRLAFKQIQNPFAGILLKQSVKPSEVPPPSKDLYEEFEKEDSSNFVNNISEYNVDFPTNIPLSQKFKAALKAEDDRLQILSRMKTLSADIQLKAEINKRLIQISMDKQQINRIFQILRDCTTNKLLFEKYFVSKILEQARIQITKQPSCYSAYAYLFCKFYNEELFAHFRCSLITGNQKKVVGMYALYFGILKLKRNVDEAWFFVKSVVEMEPTDEVGDVIESFYEILGEMISKNETNVFIDFCKQMKINYVHRIPSVANRERIYILLNKFISE